MLIVETKRPQSGSQKLDLGLEENLMRARGQSGRLVQQFFDCYHGGQYPADTILPMDHFMRDQESPPSP